ncbi:putative transmembrane protein [Toxoplasma gondii RUB]|uniref:Putative transmembrane protein n=1 Tax=Toxoplasma gondii RUB TaxID=935652 RepID=A0A086LQ67_TOXGO|nr:putative transmembrane protein [Toxoplasma gondii RUB]
MRRPFAVKAFIVLISVFFSISVFCRFSFVPFSFFKHSSKSTLRPPRASSPLRTLPPRLILPSAFSLGSRSLSVSSFCSFSPPFAAPYPAPGESLLAPPSLFQDGILPACPLCGGSGHDAALGVAGARRPDSPGRTAALRLLVGSWLRRRCGRLGGLQLRVLLPSTEDSLPRTLRPRIEPRRRRRGTRLARRGAWARQPRPMRDCDERRKLCTVNGNHRDSEKSLEKSRR